MGFSRTTQILTSNGWCSIFDIEDDYLVWTGAVWSRHGGLMCAGDQNAIDWKGIRCSPDQEFLDRPKSAFERRIDYKMTPDVFEIMPQLLAKAFRKARQNMSITYRCRLNRQRPHPQDSVMFDIDKVKSYVVLTYEGPIMAVAMEGLYYDAQ